MVNLEKKRKDPVWNKATIYLHIGQIKKELRGLRITSKEKLRHCLRRIELLENESTPTAPLRRYIYIVNALILHEAGGGLNDRQLRGLVTLGQGILKAHRILPTTSKLCFLYGYLHLALAHIYRRKGQLWKSIWEQQLAYNLSQRTPTGGRGYQSYFMGLSAARLGFGELTELWLPEEKLSGVNQTDKTRATIERIKLHRLTGDTGTAKRMAREFLERRFLLDEEKKEPEWEILCCQAIEEKNIEPLVLAVLKGKSHHGESYLLEAFLWTRSIKSRRWVQRFTTAKQMARNPKLNLKQSDKLYKYIQTLERAYDTNIPFILRLKDVGEILEGSRGLFGLETELLIHTSIIRWLSRNRSYWLASLLLMEYRKECLALSSGKVDDILGVLGDLDPKEWFKDEEKSDQEEEAA